VRREHSRAELARKLAPHAESAAAIEAVLDLLLSKKQQSDERFASERARVLSRKYGAAKIRHDLKARGIADQLIEQAMRPAPSTFRPFVSLHEMAHFMIDHKLESAPITTSDGRLVGLLMQKDVVEAMKKK